MLILFWDFKDSDKWNERAMTILEQHLSKEINADGFQFDTVHYHISDIDTYCVIVPGGKKQQLYKSRRFGKTN
jgi:hypothetical protein